MYTMADFDPAVYGGNVRARLQLMEDCGIKLSGSVEPHTRNIYMHTLRIVYLSS